MKKILIVLGVTITMVACTEAEKKAADAAPVDNSAPNLSNVTDAIDTSNFTSIEWIDKVNQTLPKIKEGDVIEVTYRFKNTGTKPLIVMDVTASCGCTVPEKPKEPILPGNEGLIKAKFDSRDKPGPNTKTLTVLANTNGDKILTFSVDVEKK
jgi:hypothetical protein